MKMLSLVLAASALTGCSSARLVTGHPAAEALAWPPAAEQGYLLLQTEVASGDDGATQDFGCSLMVVHAATGQKLRLVAPNGRVIQAFQLPAGDYRQDTFTCGARFKESEKSEKLPDFKVRAGRVAYGHAYSIWLEEKSGPDTDSPEKRGARRGKLLADWARINASGAGKHVVSAYTERALPAELLRSARFGAVTLSHLYEPSGAKAEANALLSAASECLDRETRDNLFFLGEIRLRLDPRRHEPKILAATGSGSQELTECLMKALRGKPDGGSRLERFELTVK